MWRAQVVTEWVPARGPGTRNHPKVVDEYDVTGWSDQTGQPADNIPTQPNEYTIEIEAEERVVNSIARDPDYEVLWSEEIPPPDAP